jgi:NTP pyrophosphatase (non-canonical NTP hydrolase)
MTFDEYQKKAYSTNLTNKDEFRNLMQQILGLSDEVGEVQAIFKKWIRDQDADPAKLDLTNVKKELGDIMWYIAVVGEVLGLSLSEIVQYNVDKLADRKKRGTLPGSGDNR